MTLIKFKNYPDKTTPLNAENFNHNFDELKLCIDGGWIKLENLTFTFASFSNYTGIINTSEDLTSFLNVGMKFKLDQSTTKHGFITAITATQITLFMGTDYTLTSSVISNVFCSITKTPYGFPLGEEKWSIIKLITAPNVVNSPSASTVYNIDNINLPIGRFKLSFDGNVYPTRKVAGVLHQVTGLSTAPTSFTDPILMKSTRGNSVEIMVPTHFDKEVINVANTTHYLNVLTVASALESIGVYASAGSYGNAIIKAVCAYL